MATADLAPPTRAAWADGQLRRAILHGELRPGDRLHADQLGELWGVSPTPLRESFNRLAGEGLVVIEPQRGARVASLSIDEAVEIYELRLLLDPVALERSISEANGDADYVANVHHAHAALTAPHATLASFHDAHREFHLATIARCPNQRLRAEVERLLEHSQRFHITALVAAREQDPAEEHRELVAAIERNSPAEAATTLRRHLDGTLAAIRASDLAH